MHKKKKMEAEKRTEKSERSGQASTYEIKRAIPLGQYQRTRMAKMTVHTSPRCTLATPLSKRPLNSTLFRLTHTQRRSAATRSHHLRSLPAMHNAASPPPAAALPPAAAGPAERRNLLTPLVPGHRYKLCGQKRGVGLVI